MLLVLQVVEPGHSQLEHLLWDKLPFPPVSGSSHKVLCHLTVTITLQIQKKKKNMLKLWCTSCSPTSVALAVVPSLDLCSFTHFVILRICEIIMVHKAGQWCTTQVNGADHRLTASSRGNTFVPIYVTFLDAQNRPNKCNSYAKGLIWTSIHCKQFVS